METKGYEEPVARLLTLGDPREREEEGWEDYKALGITQVHVPALIRMTVEEELFTDSDGDEIWAGVHAWRALAQLRAEEAVEPLTQLLYRVDEYMDDWVSEELPVVFRMIGPAAMPVLSSYLTNDSHGLWARVAAARGVFEIAQHHPGARDACIAALRATLVRYRANDPTLNGFIIYYLVELEADPTAPLMERAFNAGEVDLTVMGDWEEVQVELGLLEERETPTPRGGFFSQGGPSSEETAVETEQEQARRRVREIGRNEPCWCGSGRKYKHCHLREDKEAARG